MSKRLDFIKSLQEREVLPPKIKIGENTKICSTAKIGNDWWIVTGKLSG